MCGFVGAFASRVTSEEVASAARVIEHRGPDGTTYEQHGPLSIAASRLGLVPPLTESAVLRCQQGTLAMNGEVYAPARQRNPDETDTRAVMRLLAGAGAREVLPQLRGMFALAWFDGSELVLARDRFGIKPLYYARFRGGVIFASEMKAILSLPSFSREPDLDVLSAVRTFGHNVLEERTPFACIRAVEPGTAMVVGTGGTCESYVFAKRPAISPERAPGHVGDVSERVEQLLSRAVANAMKHDPHDKAVFFSGGLDSTVLLDLAREYGPLGAMVLTDRPDAEDLLEARRIAQALDVSLTEVHIGPAELAKEIVHYAWHFERPICGGVFDLLGGVAFHALARAVSGSFKVALCGEGADELFLGYHRMHVKPELTRSLWAERVRKHATPSLRLWYEESGVASASNLAEAARQFGLRPGLSEYHLPSVDCSGMAFGLEIRPPYLDEDLTDFVGALPESALLDREENWTKIPLRAIARKRLANLGLERVWIRRKRAMPTAIERASKELAGALAINLDEGGPGCRSFGSLMEALFWHLHVDPGYAELPDFTLAEFAQEHAGQGRTMW